MTVWIIFIFLVLFGAILVAVSMGLRMAEQQQRKQVAGMLRTASGVAEAEPVAILREQDARGLDSAAGMLSGLDFYQRLQKEIQQAGMTWHPIGVIVAMVVLAIAGGLLGSVFPILVFWQTTVPVLGVALGSLPYVIVRVKRAKRLGEFEAQFPEALDFLARSMRAGHAFAVSLEMLATESPEPLGMEFRQTFNEQNLGAPIDVALYNLADRVPLVDVRFFVSAVMLQRETGGNLGEILMKLAYVIRERFRLKGQVKAASAHGRLTATILVVMPIVVMLALFIIAPGYLQSMADDPDGKWMIVGSIFGQLVGYYFIRRIINIKV